MKMALPHGGRLVQVCTLFDLTPRPPSQIGRGRKPQEFVPLPPGGGANDRRSSGEVEKQDDRAFQVQQSKATAFGGGHLLY